ncbi:MAG: transporter substrate-binding domain-containing protein [Lachnospiraceae bacterium]|nr:transporter substrate-binding domain-containing protein [Lachnospiraceae bacterium]
MDKILSLSLIFILISACGCSSSKELGAKPLPSSSDVYESVQYDYIVAADKINMAPFTTDCDVNNLEGLNFDIIRAIGKDQGISFEIQPLNVFDGLESLKVGLCDAIIYNYDISDEDKNAFLSSESYFTDGYVFSTSYENNEDFDFNRMKGKTVGVYMKGSENKPAKIYAEEYEFEIKTYSDRSKLYDDVKNGVLDFMIYKYSLMSQMIKENGGVKIVGDKLFEKDYYIYVMPGKNEILLDKINLGIENIKENGEYERILSKYISDGRVLDEAE